MAAKVSVSGVSQAQKQLRSVQYRLFPKRGGPVLSGLRAGATVIRGAWRNEIDRQVAESQADGSQYQPTGTMRKSVKIYRIRRPERMGATEAVRVTIDPLAKYKSGDESGERVAAVAGILENGRSDMPAKALVRKAFDASEDQAIAAIQAGIEQRMAKILSKL
jgi:hypothetical protein